MNKILYRITCAVIIVSVLLLLNNCRHSTKNGKAIKLTTSDHLSVNQRNPDDLCPETTLLLDRLRDYWSNPQKNKNIEEVKKNLLQNPDLKRLESLSLQNNSCGADATVALMLIFSLYKDEDKLQILNRRMIDYANNNNYRAIQVLCFNGSSSRTEEQSEHYCEVVLEDSLHYTEATRNQAISKLIRVYSRRNDVNGLIKICNNTVDSKLRKDCIVSLRSIASDFFKANDDSQAFLVYQKMEPFDETGTAAFYIALMYKIGNGVGKDLDAAIYWYQSALMKESESSPNVRGMILNELGTTYEEKLNYISAFKHYRQAANLGCSLAFFNVGKLYATGRGAIQDNLQAYAWLSIAVAHGLNDKNRQGIADNLRSFLTDELVKQDKTGAKLKQGQALAELYYKQYILHETPLKHHDKNFSEKLKMALEIFKK